MLYRFVMRLGVFLLIFFYALNFNTSAQEREFGDVTLEDFDSYDSSYDSTASAIVYFDVGEVWFDRDWTCIMRRHVRIKILNESGLDYAEIVIPFNEEVDQDVSDIKATTYLKSGNEIKKFKLDGDDILEENMYDKVFTKKFILPSVAEGAVIEYSYEKEYGNPVQMPDWSFNRDIPVQYSEIKMSVPQNLKYKMVVTGTMKDYHQETDSYRRYQQEGTVYKLWKEDLPAVEDLPFINTKKDFESKLLTQIEEVRFPSGKFQSFLKTWEKVADEVRSNGSLGKQRADGAIKDAFERIVQESDSDFKKMTDIFNYVSENIAWDGWHGVVTDKGIRDAFEEKGGNSADVNLLVYEFLELAGIKVNYGLISTRNNGVVITDFPLINQFNHIVTVVEIEGETYVLDATEGKRPVPLIPEKDLYRNIFVVQDDSYGWLRTRPLMTTSRKLVYSYKINGEGKAEGKLMGVFSGYYAQDIRKELTSGKENEFVKAKYAEGEDNLEVSSVKIENLDDLNKNIHLDAEVSYTQPGTGNSNNDIIYLNPWLFLKKSGNPFTKKKREFPVYFPYPFQEQVMINITLPEGYVTDEVPESVSYKTDPEGAQFTFMVQELGNVIQMVAILKIDEYAYEAAQYESLKTIFDKLTESYNKTIVLKKKDS